MEAKYTSREIEEGKRLFSGECDFIAGAVRVSDIPPSRLTEVCFAGRSNVGKSSLINALTNRNKLARTSSTPGATRQVNFFEISRKLILADLPGYGYAAVGKQEKLNWNDLIKSYLRQRPNLKRVFVLVDSRHGVKKIDEEIMDLLDDSAVSYMVVLTKIDKVGDNHLQNLVSEVNSIATRHAAMHPVVLYSSSENKKGMEILRAEIVKLL